MAEEKNRFMQVKFSHPGFDLFVSGLKYSTKEEDLRALFSKYGPVVSVIIPMKHGRKYGVAFVKFDTEKAGRDAIEALNEKEIDGRKLLVEESKPRDPNAPKVKRERSDQPPRYPDQSGRHSIDSQRDYPYD